MLNKLCIAIILIVVTSFSGYAYGSLGEAKVKNALNAKGVNLIIGYYRSDKGYTHEQEININNSWRGYLSISLWDGSETTNYLFEEDVTISNSYGKISIVGKLQYPQELIAETVYVIYEPVIVKNFNGNTIEYSFKIYKGSTTSAPIFETLVHSVYFGKDQSCFEYYYAPNNDFGQIYFWKWLEKILNK